MAITDLRFAASLLKSGFTAAEVKQIIGISGSGAASVQTEEQQEITPEPETEEQIDSDAIVPDQNGGSDQGEQDPETEQPEPEAEQPEPEKSRQNPLTRDETPKRENLVDALSRLL